jgi:predicted transcriptional regulator of viral defense system
MMQAHNVGACEHFPTLCIIDVAMSQRDEKQILSLIKELGVVRPMDLQDRGYPRGTLYELLQEGLVKRQARGLYVAIDHAFTSEHTFALVAKRIPNGVICLLTALRFHGLTTQMPREVWIAVPEKARRPRLEYPRLRIARFSGAALTEGLETHPIEGVAVRIYSAAKTVADCFKYRNKVGIDVAVEALKDYSRMHRGGADELMRFARICRVTRVMQPYLDAIA